jgi:hypothetical protein
MLHFKCSQIMIFRSYLYLLCSCQQCHVKLDTQVFGINNFTSSFHAILSLNNVSCAFLNLLNSDILPFLTIAKAVVAIWAIILSEFKIVSQLIKQSLRLIIQFDFYVNWIEFHTIFKMMIHSYIPLTLYPLRAAEVSQIFLRDTHDLPKLVSYEKLCRCDRW